VRATVALLIGLAAHPLHTTLTELSYGEADGVVHVSIRAFADDLRAALGGVLSDSAASAYARSTFTLADRAGRTLPLVWCGQRRTGDVVWLCLRAAAAVGARGLQLRAGLLFERYPDQINIVQATDGARRWTLLFTRGDPPRSLP
jgi:hypothetical protein